MTRDDITRMAREAGLFVPQAGIPENGALTRFAALVAAAELRRLLDRRLRTAAIETQTLTRGTQPPQSAQEAADNARLIAAAPDLLEALKAWLASDRADQSIIAGRDVDGHPLSAAGVARVKARAAIARATGGQ